MDGLTLMGNKQKFTGYKIDVPGLFLGRGKSNNRGKIKKLYTPEDIVINIDRNCVIPQPPDINSDSMNIPRNPGTIPWRRVIHNNTVEFVAKYFDPVTGKMNHRYIANESLVASKKDYEKFEKARKLNFLIDKIREENNKNLKSSNKKERELAVVLWLIDNAAIRVGGEKDEDDVDTVGATTLRKEHIQFLKDNKIKLSFLGKDSVLYDNIVPVESIVYKDLEQIAKSKKPKDKLFSVKAKDINAYLKSFDKSLTAKIFRTYHASKLFEENLNKQEVTSDSSIDDKLVALNDSNIEVAMLCNHKRGVQTDLSIKTGKLNENLKKAEKGLKTAKKEGKTRQIAKFTKQIKSYQDKLMLHQKGGEVTCTTSKANYIDPRLFVSWSERMDVPVSKVYSKALLNKYDWAIKTTGKNFEFIVDDESKLGVSASSSPKKSSKKSSKKSESSVTKKSPKKSPKSSGSSIAKPSPKKPKPVLKTRSKSEPLKTVKRVRFAPSPPKLEKKPQILKGKHLFEKLSTIDKNLMNAMQIYTECFTQTKKQFGLSEEKTLEILNSYSDINSRMIKYKQDGLWIVKTKTGFIVGTTTPKYENILESNDLNRGVTGLYFIPNEKENILKELI